MHLRFISLCLLSFRFDFGPSSARLSIVLFVYDQFVFLLNLCDTNRAPPDPGDKTSRKDCLDSRDLTKIDQGRI